MGMAERPDDRYEVRARIAPPPSRGPKLLALALAVILAGWGGLTLADRLGGSPAASPTASRFGSAAATLPAAIHSVIPTLAPGVTYPPVVEAFEPSRLPERIPILRDGLVWLDPFDDLVDKDLGPVPQAWPFVLSDGRTVCVCIAADKGGPQRIEVIDFDSFGGELSDLSVPFDATAGPEPMDAVIAPDGRSVIVAAASAAPGGGAISLWRIPVAPSGTIERRTIPGIDLSPVGDLANVQLRLALTPDGGTLRVALDELTDDLSLVPGAELAWLLDVSGGRLGAAKPDPRVDSTPGPCPLQAWATDDDYVQICRSNQAIDIYVQSTKRPSSQEEVSPVAPGEDIGWLVDGTPGVVYGWSATGHRLIRLDVRSRSFFERELGGPLEPSARPAETAAPTQRLGLAHWQPLRPAWDSTQSPVVGSPDGAILYGVGLATSSPASEPTTIAPTGIWAFDAASMAIVGHWAPIATYTSLGETADGRLLIALGTALPDEAAFGSEGTEITYVARDDGAPVLLARRVDTTLGWPPMLLPITPLAGSGG
jgi:hypothetical protein